MWVLTVQNPAQGVCLEFGVFRLQTGSAYGSAQGDLADRGRTEEPELAALHPCPQQHMFVCLPLCLIPFPRLWEEASPPGQGPHPSPSPASTSTFSTTPARGSDAGERAAGRQQEKGSHGGAVLLTTDSLCPGSGTHRREGWGQFTEVFRARHSGKPGLRNAFSRLAFSCCSCC